MAKQAFLVNAPKRRRRKATTVKRKTSRRKSATRKSVPAWVKSKGYSSWGAYMASIRPSSKGGKVAKRRRKRASAARPVARRRRRRATYRRNPPVAYAANPRRRRRSYRRNPVAAKLGNIPGMLMNAGVNAVGVVAGKAGARIGRAQLKMEQGTPVGFMAELGIGVAGGILLQRVNRNFATMFTTGAMVSVIEGVVKQLNVPLLSSALGDEGELNLISGDDDITRYLNRGQVSGYEVADSGLGEYGLQEA